MLWLAATDFASVRDLIVDAGAVATALAAVCGVLYAVVRWGVLKPLDRRIQEATRQIQPDANGGLSLADVAKQTAAMSAQLELLRERFENLEDRQMVILEAVLEERKVLRSMKRGTGR